MQHPHSQQATLSSLTESGAVLLLEDGQKIHWPKNKLPAGAKPGDVLTIIAHTEATEEEERQKIAHTVLNTIFQSKS